MKGPSRNLFTSKCVLARVEMEGTSGWIRDWILRIKLTEFADGLDVGFVRRREQSRKNPRFLYLSNWKD